jgi:hypothetical protein
LFSGKPEGDGEKCPTRLQNVLWKIVAVARALSTDACGLPLNDAPTPNLSRLERNFRLA